MKTTIEMKNDILDYLGDIPNWDIAPGYTVNSIGNKYVHLYSMRQNDDEVCVGDYKQTIEDFWFEHCVPYRTGRLENGEPCPSTSIGDCVLCKNPKKNECF